MLGETKALSGTVPDIDLCVQVRIYNRARRWREQASRPVAAVTLSASSTLWLVDSLNSWMCVCACYVGFVPKLRYLYESDFCSPLRCSFFLCNAFSKWWFPILEKSAEFWLGFLRAFLVPPRDKGPENVLLLGTVSRAGSVCRWGLNGLTWKPRVDVKVSLLCSRAPLRNIWLGWLSSGLAFPIGYGKNI